MRTVTSGGLSETETYEYDALGRTICETRPGFRGGLLVTSNEYNTANQLIAIRGIAITWPIPSRSRKASGLSNRLD